MVPLCRSVFSVVRKHNTVIIKFSLGLDGVFFLTVTLTI